MSHESVITFLLVNRSDQPDEAEIDKSHDTELVQCNTVAFSTGLCIVWWQLRQGSRLAGKFLGNCETAVPKLVLLWLLLTGAVVLTGGTVRLWSHERV